MMKYLERSGSSKGSDGESDCRGESPSYSLEELRVSMEEAQKKHFGYKNLKDFQVQAVHAAFHKRDSFIVMATGMGKSMCYQIPSIMREARGMFTLVISPLISLMKDQVDNLTRKNIASIFLGSGQKLNHQKIIADVREGKYRIVYCSPEYILNNKPTFVSLKRKLLLIAIDEIHCMSEWGHDFRPSYRKLHELKTLLSGIPVMGLTATCTKEVQDDILRNMQYDLNTCMVSRSSVNKKNLFYRVRIKTELYEDLKDILDIPERKNPKRTERFIDNSKICPYNSTLIYVSSKKECESICAFLRSRGLLALMYHADLTNDQKREAHEQFLKDQVQIIVATVAFGMGIDKPDIRRIIHYGFSRSLEAYVQQVGRAGRDNGDAEAILFFNMVDESKTKNLIIRENVANRQIEQNFERVQHVINMFTEASDYAYSNLCRRKKIYEYFDEHPVITENVEIFEDKNNLGVCFYLTELKLHLCGKCDNCVTTLSGLRSSGGALGRGQSTESARLDRARKEPKPRFNSNESICELTDLTEELRVLLKCIQSVGGKIGLSTICKILIRSKEAAILKKRFHELDTYGKGAHRSQKWWSSFIKIARNDKYIKETLQAGTDMAYLSIGVTPKGSEFLKSAETYSIHLPFFLRESFEAGTGKNKATKKASDSKKKNIYVDPEDTTDSTIKPFFTNRREEWVQNRTGVDALPPSKKNEWVQDRTRAEAVPSCVQVSDALKIDTAKRTDASEENKYGYLNVDQMKLNRENEERERKERTNESEEELNDKIMQALLRARMLEARRQNVPPFQIISDQPLKDICKMRLSSVANIRKHVYNISPICPEEFLEKLVHCIKAICLFHGLAMDVNIEDCSSAQKSGFSKQINPSSINKFSNLVSSFQYGASDRGQPQGRVGPSPGVGATPATFAAPQVGFASGLSAPHGHLDRSGTSQVNNQVNNTPFNNSPFNNSSINNPFNNSSFNKRKLDVDRTHGGPLPATPSLPQKIPALNQHSQCRESTSIGFNIQHGANAGRAPINNSSPAGRAQINIDSFRYNGTDGQRGESHEPSRANIDPLQMINHLRYTGPAPTGQPAQTQPNPPVHPNNGSGKDNQSDKDPPDVDRFNPADRSNHGGVFSHTLKSMDANRSGLHEGPARKQQNISSGTTPSNPYLNLDPNPKEETDIFGHSTNKEHATFRDLKRRRK